MKRKLLRKIHNGILYVLNCIASIGFILSAMCANAEGKELLVAAAIFIICGGWLSAVIWANLRLGNF